MSGKLAPGKSGVVANKKPATPVCNVLLTDSQNKSGSTESLASEMETVIIQGTDFAKEFEKPNDRASHIKIGRAKQKVISGGGQLSIVQCTSVSGLTSSNAGKPTVQKTATKPPDGPCRTSDLEGSAGNNSCAAKNTPKKVTTAVTTSVPALPVKTGPVASKANVSSSKTRDIANASKPNNMLSRPNHPPPAAISGRPVEMAANISHRPNFANMRSNPAPGGMFPGTVQLRGRGPGTNFNPQRPVNRMPANLFNAGRPPNVPVMNVRNPRPMAQSGFTAVRPPLGIAPRQAGPRPVRMPSGCPVNKRDIRRPTPTNPPVVRQRPLVPENPNVKPCVNTRAKPATPKPTKVNPVNDAILKSGKKEVVNKTSPHPVIAKTGSAVSVTTAPTPTTQSAAKTFNHATVVKPIDNILLVNDKNCPQGGNSTAKPATKPAAAAGNPNPNPSASSEPLKPVNNNTNTTSSNKTVQSARPEAKVETTTTPNTNNTSDKVKAQNQPSATPDKELQNVAEPAGTCDNINDALDDASKGGISFSFNRKMGQKLPSSVPFGKEDEKGSNSVALKSDAIKDDPSAEKGPAGNKELPSAGLSFLKVLNKEQTLELDWPVEMILYTKTQPSITYSCNPLFFDFKELLTKDKTGTTSLSNQAKVKSDGTASTSKTEPNNTDSKEEKSQLNANDSTKGEKTSVKKSRKKKRKLSSQRHTDDDETKSKKKKKHSSKKREDGISEKDDKNAIDTSKNKSRKKKKKKRRSHHSAGAELDQGLGDGGNGDGVCKMKSSHKSKHKKHKSRKSKKKRHKTTGEFEKDARSGHESEEDVAVSAAASAAGGAASEETKAKRTRKPFLPKTGKESSGDDVSKVEKAKPKVASGGTTGEKTAISVAPANVTVCEEAKKDVCKKRSGNNPPQTLESVDESKKPKKEVTGAAKPGSCTERKRPPGEVDSPVGSKKKQLSSKPAGPKSEDTWSKMETIFEARADPESNKGSWDTSSDSDVTAHENKANVKSKSTTDSGKRKKVATVSRPSEKQESNANPASKMSGFTVKIEPKAETFRNSSGSDSDRPASAKQVYKRKKSYSGESHHSDSHCRSRERSYSSSYSDRDSHYSDKSKRRHSRSHSSSRSRSRSRSASYERHGSRRGRWYSNSSYSDEDYRYRRGHSRSRSVSRRRSRTRSRSYSRSRRYRSYSSDHHRSYSSSSSRSRSRSASRGRSRSYSYSRSHSKSTSYSRSRSRSRSYHKSHSRSRSPHKPSKQDYRHKNSPERSSSSRYYSKKNSKHASGGKGENEKGGKLDPAKIPLPIMPGDDKEESAEGLDNKSKEKKCSAETSKTATPAVAAAAVAATPTPILTTAEVVPSLHAVSKDLPVAVGPGEPEPKSGLINIPLPPFQIVENAQLAKVDGGGGVDGQLRPPPPPPPHVLSLPPYPPAGDCLMHHPIPDLSQPPPSTSLMTNCPPPPPPPPPPILNNSNNNIPGMQAARLGAPSLYGHLIPTQDVSRMNALPPPPPPKCGVDPASRMPLPFTPRSVTRHEQSSKETASMSQSPIEASLQATQVAGDTVEKEMTPPLPPPKSPPPQPPPPPKKEDEKKSCEEISPMQPIIPPEQVEQYKHLQEMAQKHAMKQQRRQRLKDTGQPEESDDDESMEMEGQVSALVSDEELDEQPGILALPDPEPQHLQQQILLPHAQHAGSPVFTQHMVPFSQQQLIIPPTSLLQSQGAAFPIQAGGPMIAIPHSAAAHHHRHHHHHPLAGHHALHHAFHPAAAAGVPLAAAAAASHHPFHHQLIAAAPSQLLSPYSSHQPILTQLHHPGPIIIGHQVLIPRFPRTSM